MKNYYDQQQELQIALYRLESLENKRQILFERTQPSTTDYSKEFVEGGVHKDLMTEYVMKIESLDMEIEDLHREIEMLENYLKKMANSLRSMKDHLNKIFVAKYIDDLDVVEIAEKFNYSASHIYRELQIIRKILKGSN